MNPSSLEVVQDFSISHKFSVSNLEAKITETNDRQAYSFYLLANILIDIRDVVD